MPPLKKYIQPLLFLLGLCLFVFMIRSVGIEKLKILGASLKGTGPAVFFVYPFICVPDVLGWRVLFSRVLCPGLRFRDLYGIRLAGEALNNTTPFVDIGGEFLKVMMVADRYALSKKSVLTVTVVERTALFLSEITFWILGLFLAALIMPIPSSWVRILLGTTFAAMGLAAALLITQKKGLFLTCFGVLKKLGLKPDFFRKFEVPLHEIDHGIAVFYKEESRRTFLSYFFHLAGWVVGGLEIYFMFHVVNAPISFTQAVLVEAMLQMIRTSSSFIPGNLGAQEAGMALVAGWLGFHPSVGVAVSLLKRFRQFIWISVGFAIWGGYQGVGHSRHGQKRGDKL